MFELPDIGRLIDERHLVLPRAEARHIALFSHGYTYEQVAIIDGINPESVRHSISRAGHAIFDGIGLEFTQSRVTRWGTRHEGCCLAAVMLSIEKGTFFGSWRSPTACRERANYPGGRAYQTASLRATRIATATSSRSQEGRMMFRMKRRLFAVAALAALALASVIPASAGSVSVTHASCPYYNATGQSYQVSPTHSYGQTTVGQSCGYLGVLALFYDPILGDYYPDEGLKAGSSTVYYDSLGVVTPVFSYHRYGPNPGNFTTRTSAG